MTYEGMYSPKVAPFGSIYVKFRLFFLPIAGGANASGNVHVAIWDRQMEVAEVDNIFSYNCFYLINHIEVFIIDYLIIDKIY